MKSKIIKFLTFTCVYLPFLAKEMMKSGLVVARAILSKKQVHPGLHKAKKLLTNNASVIYANSITLTPGTYTIEIDSSHLLIHSIDSSEEENVVMRQKIERLLC